MNLQQFLLILRARYKLVIFTLLGTVMATLVVSLILPKEYTATASVVVDVKSPDPIIGMMLPGMTTPGYMATQIDIVQSDRVARKVVKLLKFDQNPAVRQQWMEATKGQGELQVWMAGLLLKKLAVKPARESNVITISYKAADPGFAAGVANAFTHAYIETNIELKVGPARQYAQWFGEQGKALRDVLEKAQAKLSDYQQAHGIVAIDERLDSETARLNDLSAQLTIVQAQTSDARSKLLSGRASDTLPEIVQNPALAALRVDVARGEAKLQELAGNLGRNHPQYQRAESEIATLRQKLEAETRHVTSGFSTSRAVGREKETELRNAIEAQKKKLLELKHSRDEVAVLMRDVDAAQKAYEAVSLRFNQTSLESNSTQTNVSVLNPAAAPVEPSSPKILLNTLIAVFLGMVLGVGAAFLREMIDGRVRSAGDLADILQLPVLGVIQKQQRIAYNRLAFLRRRTALGTTQ